jgi:Flp pilus assembly protein TadG
MPIATPFLNIFARDQRGNMAIMFAMTAPIVVGAIGLGVDTGYWY